jgi:hypothetical protein
MTKTARLKTSNGDSRLDGTLLAREGAPDPLGAATNFLNNLGLHDPDCITVTGKDGTLNGEAVIFIDGASKTDESLCGQRLMVTGAVAAAAGPSKKVPSKQVRPKKKKQVVKKTARKKKRKEIKTKKAPRRRKG